MKIAKTVLSAALMFGLSGSLLACQSSKSPDVKGDYRSQWTTVTADTKATTDAAKSVLMADDLKNVKGDATEVDGKVTAAKADGTKVTVLIKKVDAGSQVSVNVGMIGDPSLGASYAARIKAKAEMH